MDLSIIVPYANEYPQVAFTLSSIAESIGSRLSFEVIAVDNWCEQVAAQGRLPDQGHDHTGTKGELQPSAIASAANRLPWLRYLRYDEKLSHWGAKRVACAAAKADTFLFLDAHVVPGADAIVKQFAAYSALRAIGTLHLPLTYHILEDHRLIYKLVDDRANGNIGYQFTGYREAALPYEVPCMSTCGMMMSKEIYLALGGWPEALGIYGGGEHCSNFVSAILGIKKFIMPGTILHHHGSKRGYAWNWSDYQRNRGIACYLYGDEEYLRRHLNHKFGNKEEAKAAVFADIVEACAAQRLWLKSQQVETIDAWLDKQTVLARPE